MSNKIIKLNRGDSHEFTIKVTQKNSTEPYLLENNKDIVYFAILFPHQIFEKACTDTQVWGYTAEDQDQTLDENKQPIETTGNITIKIAPNVTRRLAPGIYYYTVKLQRGGTLNIIDDFDDPDEVRTLIERTKFIVNE